MRNLILETDLPWLDPDSPKTLTNKPWKIIKSVDLISKIIGVSHEEIIKIATENTLEFSKLK